MTRCGHIHAHHLIQLTRIDFGRRAEMHIRSDNDIGAPLLQPFPGTGQHFGQDRHLGIGLQREFIDQRKQFARG
ncbi:hypothetical protein D3C80_1058950 [compost metagenome]